MVASSRSDGGYASITRAIEEGTTIAPPSAWQARIAIRNPELGARPHSAEEMVKTATPERNSLRRPNRSASRPDTTRKAANTMLYALKIHDRVDSVESANERWIDGNAIFTIVESTNSMNTPSEATASTACRLTARRAPDATEAMGGSWLVLTGCTSLGDFPLHARAG